MCEAELVGPTPELVTGALDVMMLISRLNCTFVMPPTSEEVPPTSEEVPPTSEEVEGAYWFGSVRAVSQSVRLSVCL